MIRKPAADSVNTCSGVALKALAPLAGTAPIAHAWLVIEQHGPYGAKALVESGFPADVGRALSEPRWSSVKTLLARPSGRHTNEHQPADFRAWIAHPASGQLVTVLLREPAQLLECDPTALAAGDMPRWEPTSPMLFVCTNGKRDACCATWGRRALANVDDDSVWECSHTGGHRFAATGVLLPWGYVYGRLSADMVRAVMADARAGRIHLTGARGRSCLSPPAQCADLHVRQTGGFDGPSDVAIHSEQADDQGRTIVVLRTPAAERVPVRIEAAASTQPLPPSCGATPEVNVSWRVAAGMPGQS